MADLNELRLELRTKVGSPSLDDASNELLDRLVNSAYREIGTKLPFHETRCIASMQTVIGTSRYVLPSDCAVLRKVWDETNGRELTKSGIRTLSSRTRSGYTRQATPKHYIRIRNYIEIFPIPAAVYTLVVYYNTSIQTLVEDEDTPVLPLPWHEGIVLLARYKYWDERGDIPKAQYAHTAYKTWLADKPSEIDQEKIDMDSSVEVPTLHHPRWDTTRSYFE